MHIKSTLNDFFMGQLIDKGILPIIPFSKKSSDDIVLPMSLIIKGKRNICVEISVVVCVNFTVKKLQF